eukprot:6556887-Prorocentrum_lima.AAC.1
MAGCAGRHPEHVLVLVHGLVHRLRLPELLAHAWLLQRPLFKPNGAAEAGSRLADILARNVALDAM